MGAAMKTQPGTTDDLISYAHGTAGDSLAGLLDQLCRGDLTAGEMIAISVILRGAFDRTAGFREPYGGPQIGAVT